MLVETISGYYWWRKERLGRWLRLTTDWRWQRPGI